MKKSENTVLFKNVEIMTGIKRIIFRGTVAFSRGLTVIDDDEIDDLLTILIQYKSTKTFFKP